MSCGERDQVSDHESEPPDWRESGGWLFIIVLVEAILHYASLTRMFPSLI